MVGILRNDLGDMRGDSATPDLRAVHFDQQSRLQRNNAPCLAEAGFENRSGAGGEEVAQECFLVTIERTFSVISGLR
jgi:hypothetical protein